MIIISIFRFLQLVSDQDVEIKRRGARAKVKIIITSKLILWTHKDVNKEDCISQK